MREMRYDAIAFIRFSHKDTVDNGIESISALAETALLAMDGQDPVGRTHAVSPGAGASSTGRRASRRRIATSDVASRA